MLLDWRNEHRVIHESHWQNWYLFKKQSYLKLFAIEKTRLCPNPWQALTHALKNLLVAHRNMDATLKSHNPRPGLQRLQLSRVLTSFAASSYIRQKGDYCHIVIEFCIRTLGWPFKQHQWVMPGKPWPAHIDLSSHCIQRHFCHSLV